jgi:hypothetical protein
MRKHYLRIPRTERAPEGTGFRAAIAEAISGKKDGAKVDCVKNDPKASEPAIVINFSGKLRESQISALNAVLERFETGIRVVDRAEIKESLTTVAAIERSWSGGARRTTIADVAPNVARTLAKRAPRMIAA